MTINILFHSFSQRKNNGVSVLCSTDYHISPSRIATSDYISIMCPIKNIMIRHRYQQSTTTSQNLYETDAPDLLKCLRNQIHKTMNWIQDNFHQRHSKSERYQLNVSKNELPVHNMIWLMVIPNIDEPKCVIISID